MKIFYLVVFMGFPVHTFGRNQHFIIFSCAHPAVDLRRDLSVLGEWNWVASDI